MKSHGLILLVFAGVVHAQPAALGERLHAALAQRGLGREALGVIDNLVRHESAPPRAAPALVRELLAQPAAAADAAALFARTVPEALRDFSTQRSSGEAFDTALAAYIERVAEAQALLRGATRPIDEAAVSRELRERGLSAGTLGEMSPDAARVERASALFIAATSQFAAVLRGGARIPEKKRFASPIGIVSIGSSGNENHGPDAALIIDPGGNDVYVRAPASDAVALIFDLGGNDRYGGSDLVLRGFGAVVDFAGDDRYAMDGPGLGAAIAGASLLFDGAGDDVYEARIFGLGAAAFGVGALIDAAGNDQYRVHAWGQGFALAGGLGLLWDLRGNDRYAAAGLADPFGRGGGLSGAQGAAFGYRTALAGGIGILRDGAGDDRYEAQMFAQGTGYYYGLGLLWDEGGDDHYRAVRYAQGNGVHEAIGVLRDASGDDRYELSVGVGQGMGLDLALGVLSDAAGNDYYQAPGLAQGSATANGIGILDDGAGTDRFAVTEAGAWGHAQWSRGLPSLGFIFHNAPAVFVMAGKEVAAPSGYAVVHEMDSAAHCPSDAALERKLTERFSPTMAQLRRDNFDGVLAYAGALYCALLATDLSQEVAKLLEAEVVPAQIAVAIARALKEPAPTIKAALRGHPSCAVRAAALQAWPELPAVQAALGSSCWRLQATARRIITTLTPNS